MGLQDVYNFAYWQGAPEDVLDGLSGATVIGCPGHEFKPTRYRKYRHLPPNNYDNRELVGQKCIHCHIWGSHDPI